MAAHTAADVRALKLEFSSALDGLSALKNSLLAASSPSERREIIGSMFLGLDELGRCLDRMSSEFPIGLWDLRLLVDMNTWIPAIQSLPRSRESSNLEIRIRSTSARIFEVDRPLDDAFDDAEDEPESPSAPPITLPNPPPSPLVIKVKRSTRSGKAAAEPIGSEDAEIDVLFPTKVSYSDFSSFLLLIFSVSVRSVHVVRYPMCSSVQRRF
jgi:hypothetical protein